MFIIGGHYSDLRIFYTKREWLNPYIFVNSTLVFLPLLLGLYYEYKKSISLNIVKFIFYLALLLTTARGAVLGGFLLFFYFEIKNNMSVKRKTILIFFSLLLLTLMYYYVPSFYNRIAYFSDRFDILDVSMQYINFRPLTGMGGNTLDQLNNFAIYEIKTSSVDPLMHTHNWVLEILLRYGIIGLILMCLLLCFVYKKIKNKNDKYFYVLMLILALFQTYIRNFVFLFYLSTLLPFLKCDSKFKHKNKYYEAKCVKDELL